MQAWRYLFLENMREPVMLFWLLAFPSGLYVITASTMSAQSQERIAISLVCYVIFTSCFYGCGLSLLWKREGGFIKSFIQDIESWRRLLIGQAISCAALLVCGITVLSTVMAISTNVSWVFLIDLIARATVWSFVYAIIAGALVLLPITARSASAAISMAIVPFTLLDMYVRTTPVDGLSFFSIVNYLNPIAVSATMMYLDRHSLVVSLIALGISIGLVALSMTRYRANSVVARV